MKHKGTNEQRKGQGTSGAAQAAAMTRNEESARGDEQVIPAVEEPDPSPNAELDDLDDE